MKIVSIHQPCYLPWLGYFHKVAVADTFVVLDHVQFEKNSFINRNKILQPDGRPMWLTVPVLTKGDSKQRICDVEINKNNWASKHPKSITLCYSKTPYWNVWSEVMIRSLRHFSRLQPVLVFSFVDFLKILKLKPPNIQLSSHYLPPLTQTKSDLVLEICRREKADVYFSGTLGMSYLNVEKFQGAGIRIVFQNYQHPEYKQHQTRDYPFVPYMSALDLLMNYGPDSMEIIMRGNVTREEVKNG